MPKVIATDQRRPEREVFHLNEMRADRQDENRKIYEKMLNGPIPTAK